MTDVFIEAGSKRVFACAADWPGWCRAGKDEAAAIAALSAYASRYAPVAKKARVAFDTDTASALRVVERLAGTATTDFGAPDAKAERDTRPLAAPEAKRQAALVNAAWAIFDDVIGKAPAKLRKGPRGGGRDRDQIADHVLGAEGAYVRKLGLSLKPPATTDRAGIAAFRAAIAEAIARPSTGKAPVEKGWPQRYAARRIAWHVMDHAWEIQDRSGPSKGLRPVPFESLDFVYHPSRDVKRDVAYFTDVVGGRLRFAVEGMGARVAAIELAPPPPLLLLADHVKGGTPVLVYRVPNLRKVLASLVKRGWKEEGTFEIPHGPICSFRTPGGQRIAVYELTRPSAAATLEGRRDF